MSDTEPPAAPIGDSTGFPPIGSYGYLADCETGALLAADGSVEWLCVPRFDSPSLFAAVLDRSAGRFRFAPDERVPVSRRYLPGTNVIETTWATETGWIVIHDAMLVRMENAGHADRPRIEAGRMLLRIAHCASGSSEIELACEAEPDYARAELLWEVDGSATGAAAAHGDLSLRLASDLELETLEDGGLRGAGRLQAGENAFCALTWSEGTDLPSDFGQAAEMVHGTGEVWRRWLARGRFPDHPWRGELQRSALTLKGLMHVRSGGMVAAATTSLPETPGGERNWDYRYTWIRDATFALWSLHVLGLNDEAADFMGFVERVCQEDLQIMYGLGGERDLTERTLDHLSGYADSKPVRIGNAAHAQRQNDVYGALLDSIYIHDRAIGGVSESLWRLAAAQVEAARAVWEEPDQGIWEARDRPKHYVSSKLMCWVALDRGARLARARGEEARAAGWADEAERIRADILANGVSERDVFRQHYGTDELDASTLLIPLVRFLPATDPRVRATVLAIADELTENGLVLRYRVDRTEDGLHGVEGTFSICSFWLVSALAEIGEDDAARRLCERLLQMGGALDLYAEEIEPHSGRQLGNYPQAFTHLALINAVSHVIAGERATTRESGARAAFSEMLPRDRAGTGAIGPTA